MKTASFSHCRPLTLAAWALLAAAGLVAGCSDYYNDGSNVGAYNVQYGDKYYGSGVYSSWGYGGNPYYGGGYGGGAIIVTPPPPSAPRPMPH